MKRNNLVVRTRTTVGQKLPENWKDIKINFLNYVKQERILNNVNTDELFNMDEMSLSIDIPNTRTVASRGEKTIAISTTGHEKTNFTVQMAEN